MKLILTKEEITKAVLACYPALAGHLVTGIDFLGYGDGSGDFVKIEMLPRQQDVRDPSSR